MKYILILSGLLFAGTLQAQFTGTDSLRNYNNRYITNNPATAFTNLRLHTLLRGMIDYIDTARAGTGGGGSVGVDTLWALNDSTIRYRKNGVFRNFILPGVYDTRRKVDTMYMVNDTTIGFTINQQERTFIIPGRINFVDSIYRKPGQDSIFYRIAGVERAILDSAGSSPDSTIFATVYSVDTAKVNIRDEIGDKLNASDTANKWINDMRRRPGTDTVEKFKNGSWQFAYIDSTRAPELYGTLYDENEWTAVTDDWSINGGTWAVSANKITATGGNQSISATVGTNNSAFNQYLKLTAYGYSMLQRVKIGFKIRLTSAPGATTYGFAIGKISDNTISLPSNAMAYFNTSTNTGTGKIYLLTGLLNTTTAISDNAIPVNQNDYFYVTLEKNLDQVTVSVKNLTVDTTFATVSYTYNTNATVGALMDNTGHYGIASLGGNFTIDSVNITSNEVKNANLMFLTDSKGEYGSPWPLNFPHLVGKTYWGTISCADQSGRSQDLINRLPEIIAFRPKQAIIAQTRNDIYAGTPTATWQQNLITIDSTLRANGVSVLHLDGIYETSINQASMVHWIDSTFGDRVINTYYPGNVTGSRITDNIHPSALGMKIISNVILNSNKLANYSNYLNDVYNSQVRNPSFDSIYLNNGIKCINCTFPDTYGTNDYVMPGGAAITAAISPTWKSRIVPQSTTTAAMEFYQHYGQATSCVSCNGGFRWYTGLHTAGSTNRVASLSVGGVFTTGPNPKGGFSSQDYDIGVPQGSAFYSAADNTVGQEARLVLSESSTQNTSLRNYMSNATMDFYISGGTLGAQLNAISVNPVGAVRINTTSNNAEIGSRKLYINGSIGANKDSVSKVTLSGVHEMIVQDTTNGRFYRAEVPSSGGDGIYGGNGSLPSDVTVSTGGNTLSITGTNDSETSLTVTNNGTTAANAVAGTVTGSTGAGVTGTSTAGNGVVGSSSSNYGVVGTSSSTAAFRGQINVASTDAVENTVSLLRTSSAGAGANGLGAAIQVELETATNGTSQTAGRLAFLWSDATNATRTSRFSITGVNSGTLGTIATFDGNGNATFGTTNSIVGTATNNDAVAGNIGETIESYMSTYTNYTTNATYQVIDSITLTAGDWDIDAFATFSTNEAVLTAASDVIFVISTTIASSAGSVEGKNIAYIAQGGLEGTNHQSVSIGPYRVSLSGTTKYYLNTQSSFSLDNPQFVGGLRARRMR